MDNETLTITDNRTNRTYTVPIYRGTGAPMDLRQIKADPDDFGLMTYDPAFMNTASCQSAITFLDGDNGILRYRGYPIEQLAENCTFLEVAYLLLNGELPTQEQLALWDCEIMRHTMTHENVKKFMDGFHHDAHPMGVLISTVAALSTFYPDSKNIEDPKSRRKQIIRLIGKMPTLAAYAYARRGSDGELIGPSTMRLKDDPAWSELRAPVRTRTSAPALARSTEAGLCHGVERLECIARPFAKSS